MANAVGFDTLVKKNAGIPDTLQLIVNTVNSSKHSPYVIAVAEKFGPATNREAFCRRIFDYFCRNVEYKLDEKGTEKVYTPERTVCEGKGDCKKSATFIAAVLAAAGIEPVLKHVYYDSADSYTHIYVIVPNPDLNHYITLDPTNNCQYNKEVKYSSAQLYFLNGKIMDLRLMGYSQHDEGITMSAHRLHQDLCGASEMFGPAAPLHTPDHKAPAAQLHAILSKEKAAGKTVQHAVAKALAPSKPKLQAAMAAVPIETQRAGFLQLIENNVDGIATNLALMLAKQPNALNNVWNIVGGDMVHLKQLVLASAKKPIMHSDAHGATGWHFSLKGVLHAAAGILHAVAPIANIILPGAGTVLNHIADKAEQIAQAVPEVHNGVLVAPNLPPPDVHGVQFNPVHGSFAGNPVNFIFLTTIYFSYCHVPFQLPIIAQVAITLSYPLYILSKKIKICRFHKI